MTLDKVQLAALCRLLDEGLDIESDRLEPWLAALAPRYPLLVPRLREMLGGRDVLDGSDFLTAGPALEVASRRAAIALIASLVDTMRALREMGHRAHGSDGGPSP